MSGRTFALARTGLLSLVTDRYLLAIVALGSFLRIFDLSRKNIWLDEAYSLNFAQLSLGDIYVLDQDSPPLYYIVLHYWLPLAGNSEFALRFPSVLFGIASLVAIYKLGKKLYDVDVGRLCALLLAISVFQIRYAQEARTYTLTVLLTILSMYFFIDLVKKITPRTAVAYTILSILLIYSHVYGLFIIAAQNAYFLIAHFLSGQGTRSRLKAWIAMQLVLLGAFSPWMFTLAHVTFALQNGFWIPPTELRDVYSSFITYSSGSKWLLLLLLIFAVSSMIAIEKIRGTLTWRALFPALADYRWTLSLSRVDLSALLLLWLLMPIVAPFLVSQRFQPIYVTRYTIVASLAFVILAARGIGSIRSVPTKAMAIVAVVVLSLNQLVAYYTTSQKEQWREVAEHIDTSSKNGDLALFNSTDAVLPFNYYSRGNTLVKEGVSRFDENNIDERWKVVERAERVWLVSSHPSKNHELILKRLSESFDVLSHSEYYDIDVQLFGRRNP